MTGNVVRLIKRLQRKPAVLVSASAIGWYGAQRRRDADRGRRAARPSLQPSASAATGSARPCRPSASACAWCACASGSCSAPKAACWRSLLTPFEYGLGGPIGSGRQWMAWIARDDLVRLIAARDRRRRRFAGPVNATAPEPVRNATFTQRARPRACIARPCCACRPRRCAGSPAIWPRSCCSAASASCRTRRCKQRLRVPPREPARRAAAILGGASEQRSDAGVRCRTFRRRLPKSRAFRVAILADGVARRPR